MNKFFTKLAVIGLLASALTFNAKAATASLLVQPNTMTNLLSAVTLTSGSAYVTSFCITVTTNTGVLQVFDTPTNTFSFTNAQYTNYTVYATNLVTTWTNYYGVTNNVTNLSLARITNNIPGSTNLYPMRIALGTVATVNPTVCIAPNVYFLDGIWATNITTNSVTVNLTYRQ